MKKRMFVLSTTVAATLALLASVASAAPPTNELGNGHGKGGDDLKHPLGDAQRALRQQALEAKLLGKASGKVHEVAKGQFVELERTGEDLIFTITAEYANFPHNNIDEPDRDFDNTTNWVDDFSRDHYMNMLFSEAKGVISMRNFFIEQSSNAYAVNGDVTDWVPVPGNAEDYDDDAGAIALWQLLIDAGDGWYAEQLLTKSSDDINAYLSQFDVWDRYDYNGNGNFDEPDGYIDHFQIVHAGEGEEAGGGALGGAAIWSHRWYTYFNLIGAAGPAGNLLGGVQIGDSDYWIGDYTIEPENGGVGVFSHEFVHDSGLPDLYDTSGGENSTAFWTLMSSGSWLSQDPDTIGTGPGHLGAWEKFQLGWLNYEVAFAGSKSEHKLGPAETNTKQAQGLFVVLPQKEVTETIADPYEGDYFYYSGSGNDLDNSMGKAFTLAAGSSLTAQANVQIEVDWDYAYLVVSEDGGANWDNVETNLSTNTDPNGQNFGNGITGDSHGWVELTADLSAYTGDVLIGFRYWTDVAAVEPGFMVDNIEITGYPLDGAESDTGWTFDGFRVTTGTESAFYGHYYVAEFRQYRGYDVGLDIGPYNFGFLDNPSLQNWVESFPYQDGLLISYWDTSQSNNNTNQHPGAGLILPIDAHPESMIDAFGNNWRARIQSYDSTFGLEPTDALTLHKNSQPSFHPSLPAVPIFDDNYQYWNPVTRRLGVMNPHTGTQIRIKSVSARGGFMQVEVRPSK